MTFSKVEWIDQEELEKRAHEFRNRFNDFNYVFPIEEIVDVKLGIDIAPIPGLYETVKQNGLMSSDSSTIWIDEHCYFNYEEKYRFTLAHEIAHKELHEEIYGQLSEIENITDYKDVLLSLLSEEEYQSFEWQADYFAGCILVPQNLLDEVFRSEFEEIKEQINETKSRASSNQSAFNVILRGLCDRISQVFKVSPLTIDTRLKYTSLKSRLAKNLFGPRHTVNTDTKYSDR